jgi:phage portal protein BeeE
MFDRLKTFLVPPETKASRTAKLLAFESGRRARWTPRDYTALAREGYLANAIVHRAVRLIAENVASCSYLVFDGAQEWEAHPLSTLLMRPNMRQDAVHSSRCWCRISCCPAMPISRRSRSTARSASFMRCGPIA